MRIRFHKSFDKSFSKLPSKYRVKTKEAIKLFVSDRTNPKLKNHALSGKMRTKRSFSVTGDIRVIFQEFDDYTLVILLKVGTHNQVYL